MTCKLVLLCIGGWKRGNELQYRTDALKRRTGQEEILELLVCAGELAEAASGSTAAVLATASQVQAQCPANSRAGTLEPISIKKNAQEEGSEVLCKAPGLEPKLERGVLSVLRMESMCTLS